MPRVALRPPHAKPQVRAQPEPEEKSGSTLKILQVLGGLLVAYFVLGSHSVQEGILSIIYPDSITRGDGGWRLDAPPGFVQEAEQRCDIDRIHVNDLTLAEFERLYRVGKKPLILTGVTEEHGWNISKFSRETLLEEHGDDLVTTGPSSSIFSEQATEQTLGSFIAELDSRTYGRGLERQPNAVNDFKNFLKKNVAEDLIEEIDVPSSLHTFMDEGEDEGATNFIFSMGGPGSGGAWNKHYESWHVQVYGRRLWMVCPQTQIPIPFPLEMSISEYFKIIRPKLKEGGRPMECIAEPGDVMYIPENLFYSSIFVNEGVTVSGLRANQASASFEAHNKAYEALNNGDHKTAIYEAESVLRIAPDDAFMLDIKREGVFSKNGAQNSLGSIKVAKHLLRLTPHDPRIHMIVGDLTANLEQWQRALESFKLGLECAVTPDQEAELWKRIAFMHQQMGDSAANVAANQEYIRARQAKADLASSKGRM